MTLEQSDNFKAAVAHVLKAEGGYSNHPLDTGGPTNYGITLATLTTWRGVPCTAADVEALTEGEARAVYHAMFWLAYRLDLLTDCTLATAVFDQVVNRGPRVAVRTLQSVLESTIAPGLEIDGLLGPKTASVANGAPARELTISFVHEAQRGYRDLCAARPSQAVFLEGWLARTERLFPTP